MFKRKPTDQTAEQSQDLVVQTIKGKPSCVFPYEIQVELRRMLTSLIYQSSLPGVVAFTSALRGEGVTYNTLALGATLASDLDATVAVIELNWWAPGLHAHLTGTAGPPPKRRRGQPAEELPAIPPGPGLADVLKRDLPIEEALAPTAIPNLHVLPSGALPFQDRANVARGSQLKEVIAGLRERFDYVFLDLPATAATSDTIALASLSDGLCLVALQGVTRVSSVKQALDEVKHLPVLGVVMNRTRIRTPRWILNVVPQE